MIAPFARGQSSRDARPVVQPALISGRRRCPPLWQYFSWRWRWSRSTA